MHGLDAIDPGREIDWGKTSADYARFRPGPPESYYKKLNALDVGTQGQRILDLGTGTGVLARTFAKRGARVFGTDVSPEQIKMAETLAKLQELDAQFQVAPAENLPFEPQSFDAITANQCWLYFDKEKVVPEVKRLLKPGGVLVTSHFSWLPLVDPVAGATEQLILKHNPQWTAAGYLGRIPAFPTWAQGNFLLKGMFYYDEAIPFTRESWRGRIRACRGVGAALSEAAVEQFDREHDELLKQLTGESFEILHRIDAHIFVGETDF